MTTYAAKDGSRISDEAAQAVGPVIEKLIAKGRGTPEELVTVASDPRSPAHSYFDWDDETAAHQFRLVQARRYFRGIVVRIPGKVTTRAWEHNPVSKTFQELSQIAHDRPSAEALATQALRDLNAWRHRYAYLRAHPKLKKVFKAIEEGDV